jgi:hypothetical protein
MSINQKSVSQGIFGSLLVAEIGVTLPVYRGGRNVVLCSLNPANCFILDHMNGVNSRTDYVFEIHFNIVPTCS